MHTAKLGLFALLAALAPNGSAARPASDRFYDAIRIDDARAVQHLLDAGEKVDTRDSRGATPLMYAAAVGTPAMVQRLIEAGADVNARNSFGATALIWSAHDIRKVRMLIAKGADVNARSKRGRTPLLVAAAHSGNAETVRLLLDSGAAPPKPGEPGSPLLEAAAANDTATMKLLLERGAEVNAKNADRFTPLLLTAAHGNLEMAKALIARGADVNARTGPSYGQPVKNGPIALGHLTPLMMAVSTGNAGLVRTLLEAGADVNAADVRGMTPLMLAVATDHPNTEIVRALLRKRPALDVKSKSGESVADWAAKFRQAWVMSAIEAGPQRRKAATVLPVAAHVGASGEIAAAVEKSLELMQKSNPSFLKQGGCISCHAQNITTIAAAAAGPKGLRFDHEAAAEATRATRLQFAAFADGLFERLDPPAVEILGYALLALGTDGAEPDRTTDAMVHSIAGQQHPDGSWGTAGIVRPPTSDGRLSTTALGIFALRKFGPPARGPEMESRIAAATRFLLQARARTTEDAVMQLLGAKWGGSDKATLDALARRVIALQRENGGWAQTRYLDSDAYATGTALYALHEAGGISASALVYRRGVRYLLGTQAEDGSWYVASRSPKFQPYFDGGFPYGHDQWISQMATGWATASLSLAIPESRAAR